MDREAYLDGLDASTERAVDSLDMRELLPLESPTEMMNCFTDLDGETVFIQLSDRESKSLYPELDDRGFTYCSAEHDGGVVTAIWESWVGVVSDTPPACPSSAPGAAPFSI